MFWCWLTYFSCCRLYVYFVDILLTAWFLLIWLVHFFGHFSFCCKQLNFSCLLLLADFWIDIWCFSLCRYFLLVNIFCQFSLFEKGEITLPNLSVFVFRRSTVLYWWSPLIMILLFWLSCNKWQFALNVLFVFSITTQVVT